MNSAFLTAGHRTHRHHAAVLDPGGRGRERRLGAHGDAALHGARCDRAVSGARAASAGACLRCQGRSLALCALRHRPQSRKNRRRRRRLVAGESLPYLLTLSDFSDFSTCPEEEWSCQRLAGEMLARHPPMPDLTGCFFGGAVGVLDTAGIVFAVQGGRGGRAGTAAGAPGYQTRARG